MRRKRVRMMEGNGYKKKVMVKKRDDNGDGREGLEKEGRLPRRMSEMIRKEVKMMKGSGRKEDCNSESEGKQRKEDGIKERNKEGSEGIVMKESK